MIELRPFQLALQPGIFRFQTTHFGAIRVGDRTALLAQRSLRIGFAPLTDLGVGQALTSQQ